MAIVSCIAVSSLRLGLGLKDAIWRASGDPFVRQQKFWICVLAVKDHELAKSLNRTTSVGLCQQTMKMDPRLLISFEFD